jgi:Glycosyl transferase family 11
VGARATREALRGVAAAERRLRGRPGVVTYTPLGDHGRLGNQLFQVAATIGIAQARGARALLPPRWPYRPWFSLPDELFGDGLRGAIDRAGGAESYDLTGIDARHKHYLQALRHWQEVAGQIHAWLQPSAAARAALPALGGAPPRTAVHVRRTDVVRKLPLSYYREALDRIGDTTLVVFSDDIAWCREHLPAATYVEGNSDWVDLFLMAGCERHVTANSTFSWWGAFLSSDPAPIYPRYADAPPRPGKYHPPGWVELLVTPAG